MFDSLLQKPRQLNYFTSRTFALKRQEGSEQ